MVSRSADTRHKAMPAPEGLIPHHHSSYDCQDSNTALYLLIGVGVFCCFYLAVWVSTLSSMLSTWFSVVSGWAQEKECQDVPQYVTY
jgi:hypothetical protein